MSSTDLERMSLSSSANSVASGARTLSANVRKLHNALNLLLNDFEREQFIHCLNVYHSKRNVYDLVQTLNVILNAPSKRQLLPMLRLVIPRSDQLLFEQYTSEGLYLKSDLVASNGNAETPPGDFPIASPIPSGHLSPNNLPEFHVALRGSPDSFSTSSDGTAPLVPLLGRNFIHEPPGELRQVTMKRHKSNEGLGFSIRGGSEHGVGIYVSLVEPGSLAEKEGLRIGDQIMKVNDKVFDKVTHAEAVKVSFSFFVTTVNLHTHRFYTLHTRPFNRGYKSLALNNSVNWHECQSHGNCLYWTCPLNLHFLCIISSCLMLIMRLASCPKLTSWS